MHLPWEDVTDHVDLTDAVAAIRYMQEGKHFRKIILKF
jgi:hypothetical protein